jgi:hypothetical protein
MSPYGYDYSLAPGASKGWHSRFATVMTVGAIVAISAISGAAVALNLLAPASTTADRPVTVATHAGPASVPVVQTVTTAAPQAANAQVAVAQAQVPAADVRPTSPPPAAPASQSAPQPAPAVTAIETPPTAHVAESELTFARGYARRHAIQAAVAAPPGVTSESPRTEVTAVETQAQLGRTATRKPKAIARANSLQDQRRLAEERGPFARFDRPEKFDFARHQALAFGESRDPRANRRPAPQGMFGSSPGGFFGGLF